jgi:hypothetical protein
MGSGIRGGLSIVALSLVVTLVIAAPVGAATPLGQLRPPAALQFECPGGLNTVQTLVQDGTPYVVPSAGVITQWSHRTGDVTAGSGRLQVWRGNLMFTTFTLVGRSDLQSFSSGATHSFATRIPVSAGDLLGMRVTSNAICGWDAPGMLDDDVYRATGGMAPDSQPGESQTFPTPFGDRRLNVAATLEPDADGDGFGDETQDQCPGQAGTENGCVPDTSPPDATITKGPKDKVKTKKKRAKVTFEFTGTDARAIAGFECSLDGAAFASCSSPHTVKVKKGKHSFAVRATDQAGNVDATPATYAWKVKKKKKKKK